MTSFPFKRKKTGKESGAASVRPDNSIPSETSGRYESYEAKNKSSTLRNLKDFEDIFDTVSEGITYTTLTGRVVFVNRALTEILEMKREEIEGRHILVLAEKLLDAHNLARVMPLLEQIIKGINPGPFITEYRGKILEVESRLGTDSRRLIATIRDITGDIQGRIAVAESESRLKRAELVASLGNWELDLNTQRMYGSEGAMKIYGIKENYLGYEQIKNIPLPEYRKLLDQALHDLITGQKPYNVEFKIRNHETGEILDIFSVAEYDRKKNVVFGIIQDISYRKKIESELKTRSENLNQMLDLSLSLFESTQKEAVLKKIIDGALRIVNCNAGALYTLSGDKLYLEATVPPLTDSYPEIFRTADINCHLHIKKAVDTGKPVVVNNLEDEYLTDAERIIVDKMNLKSVLYLPLVSPGTLKGVLNLGNTGVCHEFSTVEISLGQTFSNIASLSLENALLVERLTNERNRAEESDRLKTSFLQNISHEIRTPLNAIVGFSSFLGDTSLGEGERKNYIDIINHSTGELLSIVEDVLNISQIETWQATLRESEVDLTRILENLYVQYKTEAERRGLQFILEKEDLSSGYNSIITDETKLYQVINYLLSNAFKFTFSGFVKLKCLLINNWLQISVSDTGIGIHESEQSRIFEKFYQVDKSATRKFGGTGLGLAISKAWVNLMGGVISVNSEPDKGSTFIIRIPVKPVFKSDIVTMPPPENKSPEKKRMKSIKIIVAEDEETNYLFLETILKHEGFSVLHAVNGQEAVDLYTKNRDARVILMDIKMPLMDGLTATRIIHDIDPRVPVIAQTAYAFPEDREKALEAGCVECLVKPFSIEKLNSILQKYLMVL